MNVRRHTQRGLTLVETLVALAVFAVVSLAATAILATTVTGREAISESLDRTGELQLARTILAQDLAQPVGRTVTDEGRGAVNFQGGEDIFVNGVPREEGDVRLVLTRRGKSNPGRMDDRGALERVRYVFADGELRRIARTRIDSTDDTPETARPLIRGLADARFEFYDYPAWRTVWPFRTGAGGLGAGLYRPPAATALVLDFEDGRSVRLQFYTGSLEIGAER